jgi:hypothetical protein
MGDKAERKNLDAVDGFAQIVRVMARGFAPTMRLAGYLVRLARVGLVLLVPLTAAASPLSVVPDGAVRLHVKPATAAGVNYYDAFNRTGALPDTIAVTFFSRRRPAEAPFCPTQDGPHLTQG